MLRQVAAGDRQMRLLAIAATAIIAVSTPQAFAWGSYGHSAVALVAEALLTPQAKENVRRVLLGAPLVTSVNFADERRVNHPETNRWHYVDIPDDQSTYDPMRDCELTIEGDCVLAAISREQELILDAEAGVFRRADALKRLVHWVGDVHQPFHATQRIVEGKGDNGGNGFRLRFFDDPSGRNTNMHALWDSGLLMREDRYVEDLVAEIMSDIIPAIPAGEAEGVDPTAWALSSHAIAHAAYFPDVDGVTEIIDQSYIDANLPIAKRQLALGGIHFAALLNDLLSEPLPPRF